MNTVLFVAFSRRRKIFICAVHCPAARYHRVPLRRDDTQEVANNALMVLRLPTHVGEYVLQYMTAVVVINVHHLHAHFRIKCLFSVPNVYPRRLAKKTIRGIYVLLSIHSAFTCSDKYSKKQEDSTPTLTMGDIGRAGEASRSKS